jgi:hypothetical protein
LIVEIEFEDTIHAREDEHESARAGERATGKAGACAAAEDREVMFRGEANNFGNFGGGGRKGDEIGAAFFDGAVVFVEDEIFGTGEDGFVAEKFFEGADEVAMRLRFRRWWDASHDGKRLAQMRGCVEMTWTYIGEELSGSPIVLNAPIARW